MHRRKFLQFLGGLGLTATFSGYGCVYTYKTAKQQHISKLSQIEYTGIAPNSLDDVVLSPELKYDLLISWNDPISKADKFGFDNDYLCIFKINDAANDLLLWVNHEYCDRFIMKTQAATKLDIEQEMYAVGGTIIRIKQNPESKKWSLVKNDAYNRRITALTPIPFADNIAIKGNKTAIGTLANCAGGKTPWNTLLTCEENYYLFVGETNYTTQPATHIDSDLGWEKFYPAHLPEHYGWVVEIDPYTGKAQKHTAMGRFAHECATTVLTKDGRCVVYTGDDNYFECLYKFIADKPGSLATGTLYVANLEKGEWIPLDYKNNPDLRAKFKTKLDMLVRTREAAHLVGGSKLDRPEDIEIHPFTNEVFVSLTNNSKNNNYHGAIFKIVEQNNDHAALHFKHEYFLTGGEETGFSSPDNLIFDDHGNLWFTSDIRGSAMKNSEYLPFKNNGLFMVPASGKNAGKVLQIASAPNNAEFTGPTFSPNYDTLFLSVQHPGENANTQTGYLSHWPRGKSAAPKPSVIAISLV